MLINLFLAQVNRKENQKRDSLKESSNLERKKNSKSTYLKTVSTFANYLEGKIIFGVENEHGEIIGISNVDEEKLSIENAIKY